MTNLNTKNLKLAIQKEGRLTLETLEFLRRSGFEFESYKQKLYSKCRNFPMEILYVRDDDIPDFVASGTVDLGIVGQNILNEERPKVKKMLNLRFGFCSMVLAVPKESSIQNLNELKNKTVATSYPKSTNCFFQQNKIPAKVVRISGSVEITPALGVADAVVDLVSTGSTLALNDLRILTKLYDSEAVLVANELQFVNGKNDLLKKLLVRFKAALSAKNYKYVLINTPSSAFPMLKKIMFGLQSLTITPLNKTGWISVQTVIKEDVFWDTVEKLKQLGTSEIFVLPIEKIIT